MIKNKIPISNKMIIKMIIRSLMKVQIMV